jgi:DGQHR domain-containing protein
MTKQNIDDVVDPEKIVHKIDCLPVKQPIGEIYLGVIPHYLLRKITYFDVRRVLQEQRDVERYLGIQRPLKLKKVDELKKYVRFFDASFPTSIIIAVDERYAAYDEKHKKLLLSNFMEGEDNPSIPISNIARVLDGQHRIAGLEDFQGENFDLPVTIFIGADISDQAQIFATVNLEQDKVSKNLVYDLTELAKSRSPQKTCHNIAVALDQDPSSPFYIRIKRLGVTTFGRNFEPISQATFVESLMRYISSDPKQDRDDLIRNRKLEKIDSEGLEKLPFRNLFINENDMRIGSIIYDYFSVVRDIWPDAWDDRERGQVLNRTNGFRAFMRTYRNIYLEHGTPGGYPPKIFISNYLKRSKLQQGDFHTTIFPPGSSGEGRLYRVLSGTADIRDFR